VALGVAFAIIFPAAAISVAIVAALWWLLKGRKS